MNIEDICETGPTVKSPYPRRLKKSNHLQMKLQRQHFLLSNCKILSVDPAGVRARDFPPDAQPTDPPVRGAVIVGLHPIQNNYILSLLGLNMM